MDMQSSRQLAVTQQQAWDALNDPEVLKLCIPGCDRVEATGENQYAIGMALKIGPVSAKFSGQITLFCLEGQAVLRAGRDIALRAGQWVYLDRGEPHSLEAIEDSALLLTIMFDAGRC